MFEIFGEPSAINIAHGEKITLLGSCFSDTMLPRFQDAGFAVESNPWGTIFHPAPLLDVLLSKPEPGLALQRRDLWFSWQASGALYGFTQQEVITQLAQRQQKKFLKSLETATILVITLGSAHGYRHEISNRIVANCHKMPGSTFQKELSEIDDLEKVLITSVSHLNDQFPQLKVILSVSPVRYLRDGIAQNQLSKARLLEAAHRVVAQTNAVYFPAFELISDVLRDFSWFESDLAHPSARAVDKAFDLFSTWFFSDQTRSIISEAKLIRQMEQHKILYPGSLEASEFEMRTKEKRESFLSRHASFIW